MQKLLARYAEVMCDVKEQTAYPKCSVGVAGMLSRPEAHWLLRIPLVIGDGVYVDLGTFRGRSATYMAHTMKTESLDAVVITVDMFDGRTISRRLRGDSENSLESVKRTFEEQRVEMFVHPVQALTADAAHLFPDLRYKFLFIDADHSYEGVKADFCAWKGKAAEVALVAFHDSHRGGVIKLHREISDWEEFDRVDTLSVWKRK